MGKRHIFLIAAALLAFGPLMGCRLVSMKVNETMYYLSDSETNRAAVNKCLTSIALEFGLQEGRLRGNDNLLADYASKEAGSLSSYVQRGRWQFSEEDIANFESFALKLKQPETSDQISQWLRQEMSPSVITSLSSYAGGAEPELERTLLKNVNQVIGGAITRPRDGIIYKPQRFAGVKLSADTLQLLNREHKLYCDIVELNEMLLRDAYPAEIIKVFPTNEIHILLVHVNWTGKKPSKYVQIERQLTDHLQRAFRDEFRIEQRYGWRP